MKRLTERPWRREESRATLLLSGWRIEPADHLFQLGVVLLHVVLFGGSYATHALRIARSYR